MTVTNWQDDVPDGSSIVDGTVVEVREDGWIVIEYGDAQRVLFNQRSGQIVQAKELEDG